MDHDDIAGEPRTEQTESVEQTARPASKWPWLILATLAVAYVVLSQRSVLQPGGPAPALTATDWFNADPGFDATALEGRVVVVEFWATWCPPCVQSIPHLNALKTQFADQNVVVIGLTDEDASTVKPFIKQHGIEYIIGAGSRLDRAFGVKYLPTAFVIDRSGSIVWTGYPDGTLDRAIAEAASKS